MHIHIRYIYIYIHIHVIYIYIYVYIDRYMNLTISAMPSPILTVDIAKARKHFQRPLLTSKPTNIPLI